MPEAFMAQVMKHTVPESNSRESLNGEADLHGNALILYHGSIAHEAVSLHLFSLPCQHIYSQDLPQTCRTSIACSTTSVH